LINFLRVLINLKKFRWNNLQNLLVLRNSCNLSQIAFKNCLIFGSGSKHISFFLRSMINSSLFKKKIKLL
jgi:hypothetical protein